MGYAVLDYFADAGKMVSLISGSQREVPDMILTRYACHLIAQNGDPHKEEKRCWDKSTRKGTSDPRLRTSGTGLL